MNRAQGLSVFLTKGTTIQYAADVNVGAKGIRAVDLKAILGGRIYLDTLSYGRDDPQCCPSLKGKTSYVFSKGKLREVTATAIKKKVSANKVETANPATSRTADVVKAQGAVKKLLDDAGIFFKDGLLAYRNNERSDAGRKFNKAVEVFLYSTLNIQREATLQGCYNQLVETIYRIELPSDNQPPRVQNLAKTCGWTIDNKLAESIAKIVKSNSSGFNSQEFEPSPLDELSKLQLTAEEQQVETDPSAQPKVDRVRLPASTNLNLIAHATKTTVQHLRELNPQLLSDVTPPEPYIINVPAGHANAIVALFRQRPDLKSNIRIVKAIAGDTVQKVAERYNADPIEVAKYNGLLPNSTLGAGREIRLPPNR